MKSKIIAELGADSILAPARVHEGLTANDRIKLRLSLLQAVAAHAVRPGDPVLDLRAECRAAGLAEDASAAVIANARIAPDGSIETAGLDTLLADIGEDARTMIRAVSAGDAESGATMAQRFEALVADSALSGPRISPAGVTRLTAIAPPDQGDSLHRLVMDLHKVLNRLAAQCAEIEIAGARAFGLRTEDHRTVKSFMRGLNETRPLKFDHPGLDTTATRTGERLMIQNDIGTTDAHVVVIAVEGNDVTVTYTDVHRARAHFFVGLFDDLRMTWTGLDRCSAQGLGDDGSFYLVTGHLAAGDADERDRGLAAIGASLVFLIDWNKARKVLRDMVSKTDAVQILSWAARHRIGHRGFLELGGEALVTAAVRAVAPARIAFGERLTQALGREAAIDFLKSVLRISSESLIAGRSRRLVNDQVEAELIRHLERVDSALLAIVVRQAGLAHDVAGLVVQNLSARLAGRTADADALAQRAAWIERKADRIAVEARAEVARLNAHATIVQLADLVEQAIDDLEQAAFIASLLPDAVDPPTLAALARLGEVAMSATEAAASGLAAAADCPDGRRVDADDALAAIARLIDAEHEADACERAVTRLILTGAREVAVALAALDLARAVERATDRFAGLAYLLRHYVLTDLTA